LIFTEDFTPINSLQELAAVSELGLPKQTKNEELLEQSTQHPGIFFV